jgi:hypothetical protein
MAQFELLCFQVSVKMSCLSLLFLLLCNLKVVFYTACCATTACRLAVVWLGDMEKPSISGVEGAKQMFGLHFTLLLLDLLRSSYAK